MMYNSVIDWNSNEEHSYSGFPIAYENPGVPAWNYEPATPCLKTQDAYLVGTSTRSSFVVPPKHDGPAKSTLPLGR